MAGAAGTGKSLAWLLKIYWVCRKYPGARCLIVRKTRESLTESVLVTWERDILGYSHPLLTTRPNLRKVRQSYTFPNGSTIVVGGMDKPDKVLSSEWDVIYVPEVTELELVDWETLGGRLRAGAVPYQQLIADCNPTTPHSWVFLRQSSGLIKMFSTQHKDNPRFWSRTANDWTPDGKKYMARLDRMTGARRKRFRDGEWSTAEGAIYDFIAALVKDDPSGQVGHMMPNDWQPPRTWRRVWSIDWGLSAPTVLLDWAVDPEGRMFLVNEIYRTRQRADELGQWVRDNWLELGYVPRPQAVVCDVSPQRGSEKDAEDARKLFERTSGLSLQLADKVDRDRGIREMQGRFDFQEDGLPRILFRMGALAHPPDQELLNAGKPTSLVSELPGYVWDTTSINDTPIKSNDHACDASRYSVRYINNNMGNAGVIVPKGNPVLPNKYRRR